MGGPIDTAGTPAAETTETGQADPVLGRRYDDVWLYDDADLDVIDDLDAKLEAARRRSQNRATSATLDEVDDTLELLTERNAFVERAKERATRIRVQALHRKKWKGLVKEHPPREDHLRDAKAGVNEETFAEVIVPLSIIYPKFSSDTARDRFLDDLDDARFQKVYLAAFYVNRGMRADPKAL